MTIQIEVKGIEEVRRFLKNASEKTIAKAQEGLNQAGFFMEAEVKESIAGHRAEIRSVDTGRFLNSVKKVNLQPLVVAVETNVTYAKFLEYGTSRFAPRKHFRNTLTKNQTKIVNYLKDKIK